MANFIDFKLQPTRFPIHSIEKEKKIRRIPIGLTFFSHTAIEISIKLSSVVAFLAQSQRKALPFCVIDSRPFHLIFDNCISVKFVFRA